MNRREFASSVLKIVAGTIGASNALAASAVCFPVRGSSVPSSFFSRGAAHTIGIAYLATLSGETPELRQIPIDQLHQSIRDDFRNGRTIRLQGWVLSETEVHFCARQVLESRVRTELL